MVTWKVYMSILVGGGFLVGIFGPAIQYVGGAIFSGIGVYFIGPSPWSAAPLTPHPNHTRVWRTACGVVRLSRRPCPSSSGRFGGAVPQTQAVVLAGFMLSNAGIAIFVPCMTPFALEVFERQGYTQKQVAGASSAMFSMIVCTANFLGPPIGGLMIDHLGGVPPTTTIYATAVIAISSLALFRIRPYAKPRSKLLARLCGCSDALTPEEQAKKDGPTGMSAKEDTRQREQETW